MQLTPSSTASKVQIAPPQLGKRDRSASFHDEDTFTEGNATPQRHSNATPQRHSDASMHIDASTPIKVCQPETQGHDTASDKSPPVDMDVAQGSEIAQGSFSASPCMEGAE